MTALVVEAVFFVSKVLYTGGFGAFLLKAGGAVLLSVLTSKLLGPKIPDQVATLREVSVMTRSAVEYRKRVYGEAIVSGPIVYNNLSGADNENLWYVIALCEGGGTEIESLEAVHIDGDVIPVSDIAWTPGAAGADGTGTGEVSTAKWVGANSTKALEIYWTLGNDAQVAMSKLTGVFADWTTNHRLRGTAYLVVKCIYNADTEEIWREGAPQNIRAVIKGAKVYDPRLDTTNGGSGAHRYATPATWEWSDNPSLCTTDYLMNVMGADPASSIDWPTVDAGADDCDVLVDVPPSASPANTEKRFTCNGVVSYGASHKDNLDSLLSSAAGFLSYSNAQWLFRASVWEAPAVAFVDADLAGDVSVQGSMPSENRRNTIRGVFVDPARNYEPVEFPLVTDSAYVTRDNGKIRYADLELPFTNSETMAQRIAYRILEQYDNNKTINLTLNARGAKAVIGATFTQTIDFYGWTAKNFRCIEWQRNPDGSYDIKAREDESARYTDPAVGDYSSSNAGGVTYPAGVVPAPSSLAAAAAASGGIKLSWTNPPANSYDFIDVYQSPDNAWSNASFIARVRANTYIAPVDGGDTRFYWIRAVREPELESLREPDSDTSTISATASAGTDGADALAVSYTNNSHAVPVTNLGVETWTGSGGKFYAYEGATVLTLDTNTQGTGYPTTPGEYRLDITKISGDTLTEPAITGAGTTEATLADWAGNLTTATVYRVTAYILNSDSQQLSIATDITLTPSDQGSDGGDGDDALAINYTNNSHAVPVTNLGVETWTGSGGKAYVFEAAVALTLNSNTQQAAFPGSNSRYNLNITKISGDTLTEPAITGSGTTEATLADWAGNLTTATVYRITAYVRDSLGNTLTLVSDVTLTPSDQGGDGADGSPGLPGANKITFFDDADTSISSTSAGKYGFGTSTTVGTLTWSTIVNGTSIIYFMVPNDSTGSTEDYEDYYGTIVAGDVLTWYDADAFPGRWVSFRTTGVGVAITGGYRFPVEFINHFDNGDTDNVPSAAANDVEVRWSRADVSALPGSRITPRGIEETSVQISPADAEIEYKIDSNGSVYKAVGTPSTGFSLVGAWLVSGVAADYECAIIKHAGDDPTSGNNVAQWYACSTDQTWRWTETVLAGTGKTMLGTVQWRDATTLEVLGSAAIDVTVDVET